MIVTDWFKHGITSEYNALLTEDNENRNDPPASFSKYSLVESHLVHGREKLEDELDDSSITADTHYKLVLLVFEQIMINARSVTLCSIVVLIR